MYIYADFDWLDEPMLVGELGYESLRGSSSYAFKYADDWLRRYGSLPVSADINNYPGLQYTQPGRDIFGCFSDALLSRRFDRTDDGRRIHFASAMTTKIISDVKNAVAGWRSIAWSLGIAKRETDLFEPVFNRS